MKATRLGASLTFGATAAIAVVIGTFLFALVSNESKRIPGVVDVEVISNADNASVGISWGIGILIVFAVGAAIAFLAASRVGNSDL